MLAWPAGRRPHWPDSGHSASESVISSLDRTGSHPQKAQPRPGLVIRRVSSAVSSDSSFIMSIIISMSSRADGPLRATASDVLARTGHRTDFALWALQGFTSAWPLHDYYICSNKHQQQDLPGHGRKHLYVLLFLLYA